MVGSERKGDIRGVYVPNGFRVDVQQVEDLFGRPRIYPGGGRESVERTWGPEGAATYDRLLQEERRRERGR